MTLEIDALTHQYGTEPAVDDVSFELEEGELVAILGPSGCGKTTIVQAIAGHVSPTAGRVLLRDGDVTTLPPEERQVGVVFQESTLFPHMTVGENVAYGLAAQNVDVDRRDSVVDDYLALVDLSAQRDAYPAELSGGQRRRVELARALAPEPDVLLLDEPLSALDRTLRERLREEIARIQRETGVTTLFVTHDQEEAMALADRLVVMNDGHVAGIGSPRRLYESPPTPFVASFLGRSNTFSATVCKRQPPTLALEGNGVRGEVTLANSSVDAAVGETVTCHVRPSDLAVDSSNSAESPLTGEVDHVADLGRRYDVTVRLEVGQELVVAQTSPPPSVGDVVGLDLSPGKLTIFETSHEEHAGTEPTPS
ncbi:ABC transporter ATP-binding protein [Natronobacterium gregoryi]|uniref:Molybdate/tungstate import ATP-binding protein WtpC n=2 Tax=Natronobacterium gregoryi TaxID=44930 RepID=L0AJD9_NATGS|nr:ABC transporter ATP-binding protein [Natronobacterium gregoryi]AFZ73559.1 ABC-type spermidine/putrescine transport system, ATPase component [Natronobacterium gregoryi SP2]ELY68226.1 ABC transporter [Natronobacterium gregoryi SP2]PLK20541.1 ABC transporter ATP-binding protein [Natronobacterium gregoryi SP2]SFJ17631.1 putative spermidine/putrescine transport system ATP-binding protein/molybdate/tungstate transport system ATP-binding protein [Natronobacterium gregoryi]